MKIYTVVGYWCDDTVIIKSFTSNDSAKQFIDVCEAYDKTKPKYQVGVRIVDELKQWDDNHPAGVTDNDYGIDEHELVCDLIDITCDEALIGGL